MATAKFNQQELIEDLRLIDPIWAKIIETYRFETFAKKSEFFCKEDLCIIDYKKIGGVSKHNIVCLGLPTSCIVGEAYCFEGESYDGCETCRGFSMALGTSGGTIYENGRQKYYECKNDKSFFKCLAGFLKHFKKKHQDRYNAKIGDPHGA